jgi:hypothetical protein|tara:strand:- start:62 stop:220 length:159 start_codon:yes stop_codon:yes gene_type:complete
LTAETVAALYQRIPGYNNIKKIAAADHSVSDSDMVYIKNRVASVFKLHAGGI